MQKPKGESWIKKHWKKLAVGGIVAMGGVGGYSLAYQGYLDPLGDSFRGVLDDAELVNQEKYSISLEETLSVSDSADNVKFEGWIPLRYKFSTESQCQLGFDWDVTEKDVELILRNTSSDKCFFGAYGHFSTNPGNHKLEMNYKTKSWAGDYNLGYSVYDGRIDSAGTINPYETKLLKNTDDFSREAMEFESSVDGLTIVVLGWDDGHGGLQKAEIRDIQIKSVVEED